MTKNGFQSIDNIPIPTSPLYGFTLLREDTHKKKVFFSCRTTKGVGRVNLPDH